ncbi:YafY family protein [Comamonas sp. JC664]|uniref:helix-turn-helix transcriptional regulator n=1 Tax=Comamonas sp. JC664 TaxID=2801917 RepID=UPI00174E0D34|nr:YafY family protein [Comamonas sp. JC664]MBL0695851.1 YafY family transcriptional regulator [Comamonas sp. JC664]GHG63846.1 DNA-binding protein [Comamonas sp. KCTC 72670]
MRRADRLFEILQVLRRAKGPMTALEIAEQLETSQRTVYRDLAALMARRVPIRGEAGVGYVLERGFDLPPLMLTPSEVEAVVLGAQWVAANADKTLSAAAGDVLAKVAAIVPKHLRELVDDPVVGTPPPSQRRPDGTVDVSRLREWSRKQRKLHLHYADAEGSMSQRTVWPFLVGYVTGVRVLIAWCELRRDFRYFRTERLLSVDFLDVPYPERRSELRRRWEAQRRQLKT